jgi:hypothetical protein
VGGFTRSVLGNAHGAVHFSTHLILEFWRYADFPLLIRIDVTSDRSRLIIIRKLPTATAAVVRIDSGALWIIRTTLITDK